MRCVVFAATSPDTIRAPSGPRRAALSGSRQVSSACATVCRTGECSYVVQTAAQVASRGTTSCAASVAASRTSSVPANISPASASSASDPRVRRWASRAWSSRRSTAMRSATSCSERAVVVVADPLRDDDAPSAEPSAAGKVTPAPRRRRRPWARRPRAHRGGSPPGPARRRRRTRPAPTTRGVGRAGENPGAAEVQPVDDAAEQLRDDAGGAEALSSSRGGPSRKDRSRRVGAGRVGRAPARAARVAAAPSRNQTALPSALLRVPQVVDSASSR